MKGYPVIATLLLILCLGFTMLAQQTQQEVVFENVFSAITTAQASAPFRNVGQSMHTLQVTFPNEVATVSGIIIRLERCSRNCDAVPETDWFPMGPNITTAPVLDDGIPGVTDVYAYQDYYGVFRALRANMTINTPGAEELTARYVGHVIPVVPFVSLRDDRWAF